MDFYTNFEDITKKLTSVMIKNEYENADHNIPFVTPNKLLEFKELVDTKGPWDLKQLPEWNNSSLYIFNGEIVDKDASGNILYGYMGVVYCIPTTALQLGGVYAQWAANTVRMEWLPLAYGDDPKDQDNIIRGIAYFYILHTRPNKSIFGGINNGEKSSKKYRRNYFNFFSINSYKWIMVAL
jgi:hypothetical protein